MLSSKGAGPGMLSIAIALAAAIVFIVLVLKSSYKLLKQEKERAMAS